MIVTFFGHADFVGAEEDERKILNFLEEQIGDKPCEFYLGGYGGFDSFAYKCCKKFKEKHFKASLIFITPYFTVEFQRNHLNYIKDKYDTIIYPEIEDKPPKLAIIYRNRYMIEKADVLVSYVCRDWGGANMAYKYAKKMNKLIFNLADV